MSKELLLTNERMMFTSDIIDKKIKIDMLFEVANALRSVESFAEKLDKLKQGSLTGSIFSGIETAAAMAGKNIDETKEKVKSLQQQVQSAIKDAEKEFQATGKVSQGLQENFQKGVNQLMEFKKQLGNLSIGSEKGLLANIMGNHKNKGFRW